MLNAFLFQDAIDDPVSGAFLGKRLFVDPLMGVGFHAHLYGLEMHGGDLLVHDVMAKCHDGYVMATFVLGANT